MRTKIGIWKMPIAVIDVTMPGPATAASMIAESSAGNAKVKSESRMITSSTHPLRAAASSPSEAPSDRPMPTAMIPTTIEVRAPTISSETMSRPSMSVPSQCADEGGLSLCAMSIS